MVNSSCKYFFVWRLFNGGMECWTIVLWIDVMWVLRVCFFPKTEFWGVKYSSLVRVPLIIFPEEFYPMVIVFYFDEFNNSVCFLWKVNVVSGIFMSSSVVFEVCFAFDVYWEIVLLSPVNSFVLFKSSDKYYCRQGVTGVVLCFKDIRGKPDLC